MFIYILLIILLLFLIINTETYANYNLEGKSNYANDIYSIRPPYQMAKYYSPDKLGPFRILKYDFLNYPIEG